MGKIVLEIDRHSGMPVEYRALEQDCIRIGRGFDNDVIINDPFVDARHVCIRKADNVWVCEDLGGVNGTFLIGADGTGERGRVSGVAPFFSGDTISIGKTSIRLWNSQQTVEPARILPVTRLPSFFAYQHKPGFNLFFTLVVFFGIFYFVFYHLTPKKDISVMMILAQETFCLVGLMVWSGMWAVITRFSKRQHRMAQHLLFACQWSILNYFIGVLLKYIIFFACNQSFGMLISFIAFGFIGAFILNIHMAIGTNLSAWKRKLIAGSIMLSVIVLCALLYYGFRDEFDPDPRHFINLVPVPEQIIPTVSISEEIKRLDTIFRQ